MVTISEILNIFLYQVIGICYDLVGRKIIIVATTLFASIAVGMMPFCGTVWPWLVASKLTLSFSMVALSTKPLLADYSDQKSQGLAAAEGGISASLGGVIVIMLELRLIGSIDIASLYVFHAIFGFIVSLFFVYSIGDAFKKEHNSNCCMTLKRNFRVIKREGCSKVEIKVALLGNTIISMVDSLILTFTTQWYGQWQFDGDTAKTAKFVNVYYSFGMGFSVVLIFVFGCIADRLNYRTLLGPILVFTGSLYIPIYLFQCMTCISIVVFLSFSLCILLASNVVIIQLLVRNIPSQSTRGALMGLFHMCGSIGTLLLKVGSMIFAMCGGYIVSSKEYNKMIYLIGALLAISMGLLAFMIFGCRTQKK